MTTEDPKLIFSYISLSRYQLKMISNQTQIAIHYLKLLINGCKIFVTMLNFCLAPHPPQKLYTYTYI